MRSEVSTADLNGWMAHADIGTMRGMQVHATPAVPQNTPCHGDVLAEVAEGADP